MGHTLDEWQAKVGELVRDAGSVDLTASQIVTVGLAPALAEYSKDRPRAMAAEVAGAGSSYIDIPDAWLAGFSSLTGVEFPARQNPPNVLDSQGWFITRDPVDIDVHTILLAHTPAVGQYVRLFFTAPWPLPTGTADDDPIDALAYEAVAALAASLCCLSLAGESARARWGSLPTDTAGEARTQRLLALAQAYRDTYDRFIGIGRGAAGESGESSNLPASGSLDFDPSFDSIFHGGRR